MFIIISYLKYKKNFFNPYNCAWMISSMNILNHMIVYKLLVFDRNTRNYTPVS